MTTQTEYVSPSPYYNIVCERLAAFDDFCHAKCAERQAIHNNKTYSWWEVVCNFGVNPRIASTFNWQQDFEYYSFYVMPYRAQYKRLNELERLLSHCVQNNILVQMSVGDVALLLGEWK